MHSKRLRKKIGKEHKRKSITKEIAIMSISSLKNSIHLCKELPFFAVYLLSAAHEAHDMQRLNMMRRLSVSDFYRRKFSYPPVIKKGTVIVGANTGSMGYIRQRIEQNESKIQ